MVEFEKLLQCEAIDKAFLDNYNILQGEKDHGNQSQTT